MNSQYQGFVVILLQFLAFCGVYSRANVEFYEDVNFKGLLWQGPSVPYGERIKDPCTVLPEPGKGKASSLKTEGCIIAFHKDTCYATDGFPSYSFGPGSYSNLSEIRHHSENADNSIKSFRECSVDECNGVHVSLYQLKKKKSIKLVEYFNVNNCTNLPSFAVNNVDRLNNHGHCVTAYDSENCAGKSVTLRGGLSKESGHLNHVNFAGNAKSISPCPNIKILNCDRLYP